jgi:hypothetical protein
LEIWVPYGDVESLLTLQAENLGELVDPPPEGHAEELAQILRDRLKGFQRLVVCDARPATLKLMRSLSQYLPADGTVAINAPSPKAVEEGVPGIKGRVTKLSASSSVVTSGTTELRLPPEVVEGKNLFVATGAPDPLFGYSDARVCAALSYMPGSRRYAYEAKEGDVPKMLEETKPYSVLASLMDGLRENAYVTVVTRGGEPFSLIDGGAKDARGHFFPQQPAPAKGIVVGGGGRGYDDTFSGLLRLSMGALGAVRKGGDVLLVGECGNGIGSEALQMQAQGRISDISLRRGFYADGIEEISYLTRLKEDYSVTLLSSLPDLYANGRFKFRAAKSASEALQKAFTSAGRAAKLHVFTRASETLLA